MEGQNNGVPGRVDGRCTPEHDILTWQFGRLDAGKRKKRSKGDQRQSADRGATKHWADGIGHWAVFRVDPTPIARTYKLCPSARPITRLHSRCPNPARPTRPPPLPPPTPTPPPR